MGFFLKKKINTLNKIEVVRSISNTLDICNNSNASACICGFIGDKIMGMGSTAVVYQPTLKLNKMLHVSRV